MLPLLLLALAVDASPAAPPKSDLVYVQVGTLPIILSAPHGGRTAIPDCPERKGAAPVKQFVTVNDTNTDQLTEKLAAAVEKAMGGKPHVVIARFERKYCDANRP